MVEPTKVGDSGCMLVPVRTLVNLKYKAWGIPGAPSHAWLDERAHERLLAADDTVNRDSAGEARIVVWDALRSLDNQRHIYSVERRKFAENHRQLSDSEIDAAVATFVRPPRTDLPPPHCTGGAVDVTLWVRGTDDFLGEFDDFTARGTADFFDKNPPTSDDEREQDRLRRLLRTAMERTGFVGIPQEWWHYEYGTRLWAEENGEPVLFDEIREEPHLETLSARLPHQPARQLVDVHGVAQVFPGPQERGRALRGESRHFYYARTRHHNERQLSSLLCRQVGASDATTTQSGLAAALVAIASYVPRGGRLLVDQTAYYETRLSLSRLAQIHNWEMALADLSDEAELDALASRPTDAVFCDHPRNWLLTQPDLREVRKAALSAGAKLIVDTSVQPLQRLFDKGLADVIVISLSKYPSLGQTMGGAILGSDDVVKRVNSLARAFGMVLAPEAAATIMRHLPGLPDRIRVTSEKAIAISNFLRGESAIASVNVPDLSYVEASPGGQISATFCSSFVASGVEHVIGWNNTVDDYPLALACTFGATFTTFEQFNGRNAGETLTSEGSAYIPPTMVRIGIGSEDTDAIIEALTFAFRCGAGVFGAL